MAEQSLVISGLPIPCPKINVAIHQPKVKDIIAFGETDLMVLINFLTKTEKENYQIVPIAYSQDKDFKSKIDDLFTLLTPQMELKVNREQVALEFWLEGSLVGSLKDAEGYQELKSVLYDIFPLARGDVQEYKPANKKAQQLVEQSRKYAEKLNAAKGGKVDSIFYQYLSILVVLFKTDYNLLLEYTCAQLLDVFQRAMLKEKHDLLMKLKTTPFMDGSKLEEPPEWTGDLDK